MQSDDILAPYNSRITKNYVNYLQDVYPDLNIDEILRLSGMTAEEVADTGHWFSQAQVDRFHEVLVSVTGDAHISRYAGRYIASAKARSDVNQYLVGMVTIETVYASMAKLVPMLARGATTTIEKIGPGRLEITSTPKPGVYEKPYQCENRIGTFEALPKPFTSEFAHIDHPECLHNGGKCCKYIVSWSTSTSFKLRLVRNYAALATILTVLALAYNLTPHNFWMCVSIILGLNFALSMAYMAQKLREQDRLIDAYHQNSDKQIQSANTSYNNALLVQEIGRATAAIIDSDTIMHELAGLMSNRLGFDRGLILLADETGEQLTYRAGYGYSPDDRRRIERMQFNLNNPDSKGIFVKVFKEQAYAILDNIGEISDSFSSKSQSLVTDFDVRSILCVPIVYGDTSLGIIAVDNNRTKAPLKKSDINLLQGIASHIAISISNARSFKELKESENKYRQTLENISEGYFEIDSGYSLVFVNKTFCEFMGYDQKILIGSRFDHHFSDADVPKVQRLLIAISQHEQPIHFASFKITKSDGQLMAVDISASLILDTHGQSIGYRGLIRDATERLRLEEEKKRLENQLLQAQKMEAIGALAGGIAHNFNNWLAGILGNATLIKMETQHNEKVQQRAEIIEGIIENASLMTQQLLGYARGGKYNVDLIDVNEVVQRAVDTFKTTRKDIAIELHLEPDLPVIEANRSQIEQILWNLYVNGADAMPVGGKIVIQSSAVALSENNAFDFTVVPGQYVCMTFSDTGDGIAQEHLHDIFEPFFSTKNGKGTGLGLASVYGIVKAHHGYIDVKSELGRGSTFTIYLPSLEAHIVTSQKSEARLINGNATILIIDDENDILDTTSRLLSKLGYSVMTASTGQMALEIYKAHHQTVDLVILDMIMPEISGSDLYPQLRQIDPKIKVLLSSGYNRNEQIQKMLDLGCSGFIHKPFSLSQLTAEINNIINAEP